MMSMRNLPSVKEDAAVKNVVAMVMANINKLPNL